MAKNERVIKGKLTADDVREMEISLHRRIARSKLVAAVRLGL
jgi:hypothetical protein